MISVIICTYNRVHYIEKVLDALRKEDFKDYEVLLVDNNSTDGTLQTVQNYAKANADFPLRVICESRQGLSWARNTGIRHAVGDILAFLDDDAIPRKGYLEELAVGLKAYPDACGFGGRIIPFFDECQAPKWLCRWTLGWVSGLDKGESDCLFKGREFPIGANMGLRRSALKECGEFNTALGRSGGNLMGGEEKDLFYRLKERGGKIVYLHNVVVDHVIPQKRTTKEYIVQFAKGVGCSEKRRSLDEGTYPRRLLSELIKWAATIVLSLFYLITIRPSVAATLVLFRFHVSRELLRSQI